MKHRIISLILLSLFANACKNKKVLNNNLAQSGKYMTIKTPYIQKVKLTAKYKSNFYRSWKTIMYLKEDSTFIIRHCSPGLHYSGKWYTIKDSVCLTNIYYHKRDTFVSDRKFLYKDNLIYYKLIYYNLDEISDKNNKGDVVLLSLKGTRHTGETQDSIVLRPDSLFQRIRSKKKIN